MYQTTLDIFINKQAKTSHHLASADEESIE